MEPNVSFPCWQVCILSTSWVNSIRHCPCWPVFSRSIWTLFSHSRQRFPNHFFPWAFPTKMSWCTLQAYLMKSQKRYCLRWYRPFVLFRLIIPVVFYANEGGWVRQNTTVVGSYLLVWRWLRISAVLGHLQVISYFIINSVKGKTYTWDRPT